VISLGAAKGRSNRAPSLHQVLRPSSCETSTPFVHPEERLPRRGAYAHRVPRGCGPAKRAHCGLHTRLSNSEPRIHASGAHAVTLCRLCRDALTHTGRSLCLAVHRCSSSTRTSRRTFGPSLVYVTSRPWAAGFPGPSLPRACSCTSGSATTRRPRNVPASARNGTVRACACIHASVPSALLRLLAAPFAQSLRELRLRPDRAGGARSALPEPAASSQNEPAVLLTGLSQRRSVTRALSSPSTCSRANAVPAGLKTCLFFVTCG